jgi:hypothetical protein
MTRVRSIEELKQLLQYDPETGILTWLSRPREMFSTDQTFGMWNTRYAGKRAFTTTYKGYYRGPIVGTRFLAHRVAWALHYGVWPQDHLDHINGIRTDNRIENLREANHAENGKNQKMPKNNKSGHIGVNWNTNASRWIAYIYVNGAQRHLGSFTTMDDAILVRVAAELEYGYHQNHGRSM